MKFIRDILAEKKRHADNDEIDAADEVTDAYGAEIHDAVASSVDHAADETRASEDAAEAKSDIPQDTGLHSDDFSAEYEQAAETPGAEHPAESDECNELTSTDCFDLNVDEHETLEIENKRRQMLDGLIEDATDDSEETGFDPDEPNDLKIKTARYGEGLAIRQPLHAPQPIERVEEDEIAEDTPVETFEDAIRPDAETQETPSEDDAEETQIDIASLVDTPNPDQSADDTSMGEHDAQEPEATIDHPVEKVLPERVNIADDSEITTASVDAAVSVPKPTVGRGKSGRVKTRLLGFSAPGSASADPFAQKKKVEAKPAQSAFPVGWLIVVDGPGRGAAYTLFNGVSQIGRGPDQTVQLDFGDNSISRENHAALAYDAEQAKFFLGHGGKTNLVRLNNRPVLSTEEIASGDQIRIGETILRFVALCGEDFSWEKHDQDGVKHAAFG